MGKHLGEEYYVSTIEKAINAYKATNGKAPSVYDLEEETKIPRATISRWLIKMRDMGVIEYDGKRGIMTKADKVRNAPVVTVPVYAKGAIKLDDANLEQTVCLPTAIFGDGELFIMHSEADTPSVKLDSLLLVRKEAEAKAGQLAVVAAEDETVSIVLLKEDSDKVIGVVTKVISNW